MRGANRGQRVVEVNRDTDSPRLVGDGTGDGLADPPGGVSRELETLPPIELLHGANQAEVALLDEIEEVDARGVGVAAGVGDHQPEVGGEEVVLGVAAETGEALQLGLFPLVLVILGFESSGGVFAGLDLLGELDFHLRSQKVVLADGGEVLANQVGGESPPVVGQLVALTGARPSGRCHKRRSSSNGAPRTHQRCIGASI